MARTVKMVVNPDFMVKIVSRSAPSSVPVATVTGCLDSVSVLLDFLDHPVTNPVPNTPGVPTVSINVTATRFILLAVTPRTELVNVCLVSLEIHVRSIVTRVSMATGVRRSVSARMTHHVTTRPASVYKTVRQAGLGTNVTNLVRMAGTVKTVCLSASVRRASVIRNPASVCARQARWGNTVTKIVLKARTE